MSTLTQLFRRVTPRNQGDSTEQENSDPDEEDELSPPAGQEEQAAAAALSQQSHEDDFRKIIRSRILHDNNDDDENSSGDEEVEDLSEEALEQNLNVRTQASQAETEIAAKDIIGYCLDRKPVDLSQAEEVTPRSVVSEPETKRPRYSTETVKRLEIDKVDRIFKIGEYFTSNKSVQSLCRRKENVVYKHAKDAIYLIRKFVERIEKEEQFQNFEIAECEVLVPFSSTIAIPQESKRIRKLGRDPYVCLCYAEHIKLRDLHTYLPNPPAIAKKFYWKTTSKSSRGSSWEVEYVLRGDVEEYDNWNDFWRQPNVIDFFAGAGGMSCGFQAANFQVKWCVEKDRVAAETLQINHDSKDSTIYNETIEDFLDKCLGSDESPLYPKKGECDHAHFSPPCQGVSKANRTGGKNDHENNAAMFQVPRAINTLEVKTASFENVTGILDKQTGPDGNPIWYFDRLLSEIVLGTNYQVRATVLNAAEHGDPQVRQRLVMLMAKPGRRLAEFPKPSHGPKTEDGRPFVSVERALDGLGEPVQGNGLVWVNANTGFGHAVHDHCLPHAVDKGLPTEYLKLHPHRPAPSVLTKCAMKHHLHNRLCTVRESARIQSFPDNHRFSGSITQKKKQIGNAVPGKLAEALAGAIKKVSYACTYDSQPSDEHKNDPFQSSSEGSDAIIASTGPADVSHSRFRGRVSFP